MVKARKCILILLLLVSIAALSLGVFDVVPSVKASYSYNLEESETDTGNMGTTTLRDEHPSDDPLYPSCFGQALTTGASGYTLGYIQFYMGKYGSPTATLVCAVYSVTGTVGSTGEPTGSALVYSTTIDSSTLGGQAWVTFNFTAEDYDLSASTDYAFSVEANTTNVDADNWVLARYDLDGGHDGNFFRMLNGIYSVDADDLLFKLYSVQKAAPTIGSFSSPSTVYANKYVYLNATISDGDGVADFVNATLELNGSLILKWDNATDVFSESQDNNNYCTLDAGNSVKTTVNSSSYELSWKVKFHWNYSEGSIFVLAANTIVFDSAGTNGTGVETSFFTFEDDLIVYTDAAVDDDHVDPSDTVTFTGSLYYEGTSTVPEDVTGITAYVELSGLEKGNDTTCTGGSFSIVFSAESSVNSYSYNVYAVTDQNTVTNQTVAVIVDKAKIISGGISSSYLHAGENTTVYYVVQYEYDLANITDGSVTLNGSDMTYVAARYRWEINITESTGGDVVFQIDAVSGNTHGITVLNDVAASQNCTFYVNVNIKTVDYDGNTLTSVTVSICNGSGSISGDGSPGCGVAVVGGSWFSEVVSSGGWANYTGVTNSSIQVYASWYGLIVNSTFTLSTTTDQTINVSCLCYPFDAAQYHVASDATITSVTYTNNILEVQFSESISTYSLIATGSRPTYLLNVVYDLDTDYTSYLDVTHYSNLTVYVSYANWGAVYIKSLDHRMTSASFPATKLTMTFTGTGTGQVEVYCGSRGAPAETDGFTTTSYASMTLTGYYAFASNKTVWLQWSSSSSSGGPGGDTSTPLLITLDASLSGTAFLGGTTSGLLTISWTGADAINVWSITLGEPYQDWIVQIEGLPLTLDKNLDSVEGTVEVPFTLTVPSGTSSGSHHVSLSLLFGLATGGTKTMGTSLSVDVGSYSPAPVPNMMVYVFLAVIGLIVVGGVFTKTKRHK